MQNAVIKEVLNEAPRTYVRGILTSFGGAKSAEAKDRHSSTASQPWSFAKEDKLVAMEKMQTRQYETLTARMINTALIEKRLINIEKGVGEIDKRTVFIPKLYNNVDKLIGEIIENRQERVIVSGRITKLEKR